MNLALSVVIVFVVALPGIIYRYAYRVGWYSDVAEESVTADIAYGLVAASVFHIPWVLGSSILPAPDPNWEAVFTLLSGTRNVDSPVFLQARSAVTEHVWWILLYFGSLCVVAGGIGAVAKWMVIAFELDLKLSPFLRFDNEWYYILRGQNPKGNDIDNVYITAIVDQSGRSYLYRGIVWDFFFDKSNNLSHIVIISPHRRPLEKDIGGIGDRKNNYKRDIRYYEIKGDLLSIKYENVNTLNVEYISLSSVGNKKQLNLFR